MEKIRTILVDDEGPARQRIRDLLVQHPDIELIRECQNGAEAIRVIQEEAPSLLFLDIQMPEMDGFAVLQALNAERLPFVIFVTAYDAYAIQAFEVHALDYLLKPFSDERFETALNRARQQIRAQQTGEFGRLLRSMISDLRLRSVSTEPPRLDRLPIKTAGRIVFLKITDIDWIEAAGVYVNLHVGQETHLYRETIGGLESQLDPMQFVRIHRSTMVNIDRIKELQPHSHGAYHVLLSNGTKLKLSRRYKTRLQQRLGPRF